MRTSTEIDETGVHAWAGERAAGQYRVAVKLVLLHKSR
jgi:hypothetical protein